MGIERGGGRGWLGVSERPEVVSDSRHVVRERGMSLYLSSRLMTDTSHLSRARIGKRFRRIERTECGCKYEGLTDIDIHIDKRSTTR